MNESKSTAYGKNFKAALTAGKCLVRRVWNNENSKKEQVSIQLIQLIANNAGDTPSGERSVIIGKLQGVENAGYTMVTAVASVAKSVAEALKLEVKDYYANDEVVDFSKLFGEEVSIVILESKEATRLDALTGEVAKDAEGNPLMWSPEQSKVNPQTNGALLHDGARIYRNSAMGLGNRDANASRNVFIKHNAEQTTVGATQAAKAVAEAIK
jgi:hypothetical protein